MLHPRRSLCSALLSAALAASGFSASAFATPLLSENAAQNYNGILTLYPDSVDPNLFYFMPNSSTFARENGKPVFGFTYWGLNPSTPLSEAGAYMSFVLRPASDAAQQAALDAAIRSGKSIAVLPVMSSMVGLTSTRNDQIPLEKLVEEFNFPEHGGTPEAEAGINMLLTGRGATVFKQAITNPGILNLQYCYMVQGLGPNFDARVEVEMDRVYSRFEGSVSKGGWFFRKSIHTLVEKLVDERAVRILSDGGTASEREKLQEIANQIIARIFKPELDVKAPAGQESSGWSFMRFSLSTVNRKELKRETWRITHRDLVEREFCIPLRLSDLSPYLKDVVKNADAR